MEVIAEPRAAPLLERPRRHLAVGTLLVLGAQIGAVVAGTAMSVLIARLLGPAGTGVFSLVTQLFDVVLMVFTIGLSAGITYYVSRGDWPLRQAFREISVAAVGLGAAGAAAGLLFYALTRHTVLEGVTTALPAVALASLPFAFIWAFAGAIALSRDRYEAYLSFSVVHSLVLLVAGVALAAAFELNGAIIGFAMANVVAAGVAVAWLRRYTAGERDQGPGAAARQMPSAIRFGLKTWSANLLQLLNYRLDLFLVSAFASRSEVGFYAIALAVTALAWSLPTALTAVLFPRTADVDAAAAQGAAGGEFADASAVRAMRHTVLQMVPTAAAVTLLILVAVPLLYGPAFHETIKLSFILLPGVVALGLAKVASGIFSGRGFPEYAQRSALISTPITVGLYFALIPPLEATGAAIASSVSYSLSTGLGIWYFRKATKIPLRRALVPSRADLRDYVDAFQHLRSHVAGRP